MFHELASALEIKPTTRELRIFGLALALVLIMVAYRFGLEYLNWLALTFLAAAIFIPQLLRPVVMVLLIITVPIGWIISRFVLIVFFCLIVAPVALSRRLLKHDPLNLHTKKELTTYWEELEPNRHYDKMHL